MHRRNQAFTRHHRGEHIASLHTLPFGLDGHLLQGASNGGMDLELTGSPLKLLQLIAHIIRLNAVVNGGLGALLAEGLILLPALVQLVLLFQQLHLLH